MGCVPGIPVSVEKLSVPVMWVLSALFIVVTSFGGWWMSANAEDLEELENLVHENAQQISIIVPAVDAVTKTAEENAKLAEQIRDDVQTIKTEVEVQRRLREARANSSSSSGPAP